MRLVAIDPGETTGLAFQNFEGEVRLWHWSQIGPQPHHDMLYCMLEEFKPDFIICERFTYQKRDKVVLTSVEYIGIAQLYLQRHKTEVKGFQLQTASQAKDFWTDSKLQTLDLWQPNQPHACDATRHMLYFVTNTIRDKYWIQKLRPKP